MEPHSSHPPEVGGVPTVGNPAVRGDFALNVNGNHVHVHDATPTGRQIRQAAKANPASEFVLILAAGGVVRSIALDEIVDLLELKNPIFRLFRSDRIYTLTIDERGFEWGDERLSETELRAFADISLEREIVLQREDGELVLSQGAVVSLAGRGAERFFTREQEKLITIYVNGRVRKVHGPKVSFSEIVSMAPNMPPPGNGVQFTVQFTRGPAGLPCGTLVEGQSVRVHEGMEFDVTPTNRS